MAVTGKVNPRSLPGVRNQTQTPPTGMLAPVRAATLVNGALATAYAAGQAIDGITLAVGDRILIKNQTSALENGVYVVTAGQPMRAPDFCTGPQQLQSGITMTVQEGTVQARTTWMLNITVLPRGLAFGTDNIYFCPLNRTLVGYANTSTAAAIGANTQINIGNTVFATPQTSADAITIGLNQTRSSEADGHAARSVVIGNNINTTQGGSPYTTDTVLVGSNITYSGNSTNGYQNVIIGSSATVGNTYASSGVNTIQIGYSTTSVGTSNITIGSGSGAGQEAISIGFNATTYTTSASPYRAIAIGPYATNTVNNAMVFGQRNYAETIGEISFTTGCMNLISNHPDTKLGWLPMQMTTTSNTPTDLRMSNSTSSATFNQSTPNGVPTISTGTSYSLWVLTGQIMARAGGAGVGTNSVWDVKAVFTVGASAASTALVGTPQINLLAQDAGASTWAVAISADTSNGCPKITVTGGASTTIKWFAPLNFARILN